MQKIIAFIICLPMLFSSTEGSASTCLPSNTFEEEVKKAQAIFAGKVEKIEYEEKQNSIELDDGKLVYCGSKYIIFSVKQQWRGGVSDEVIIYSGDGCLGLGGHFSEGDEYLVFAYADTKDWYNLPDGQLYSWACGRTKLLSNAQEDVKRLNYNTPQPPISTAH